MKLTVDRNELWRGIETVLDVVPNKPPLPVLSNLLLSAVDDALLISATDLDISIRTRINAAVDQSGSITVPARTFASIAREWPETRLTLSVAENGLSLSGSLGSEDSGEGTYTLSGMPAEDFPANPSDLVGPTLDVKGLEGFDSDVLVDMITKTAFAVSRDETRPVLNGVYWHIYAEGMEMVATDGSRLARARRRLQLGSCLGDAEAIKVVVPPQTFGQVVKLLSGHHDLSKISIAEGRVFFDLGYTTLFSRLIEGPYVDYEQVVPKENNKEMRVCNQHFLPAVRRVSVLSSSYTHEVRLKLGLSKVELSANSPEVGGNAQEVIPANYGHEEMELGYNANYLTEILRKIESKDVIFQLNSPVSAALVKPAEQSESDDYLYLLMPMRPRG